jgi:hypothetical protein
MQRAVAGGLAFALAAVVGCGRSDIVSVSGVVKLDGKPYPNAVVSFQPLGTKDNPNPGRGSAGVTDAQGRYALTYDGVKPGALVGKHRVRIFTQFKDGPGEGEAPARGGAGRSVEPIPVEWNEFSKKDFDVPAGGTETANFDIARKGGSKH